MLNVCIKCQRCCKEIAIYSMWQKQDDNIESVIEFYNARGFQTYFENGYLTISHQNFPCPNLTKQGCKIYSKRPKVCREYNGKEDFGDDCLLSVKGGDKKMAKKKAKKVVKKAPKKVAEQVKEEAEFDESAK